MSDQTANLKLPFIAADQAQKHVTHNEALLALDALVQASVINRDLAAPPASPDEGDAHAIAASASGAWSGHDGEIAIWQDGVWRFHAPAEGWRVWVADEDVLLIHDGAGWREFSSGVSSLNPAEGGKVGVNTTADGTNRLAVKSDAVLFSHDDVTPGSGDVRFTVNKKSPANTASVLFQDNWSGRAEIGLNGDDDFHFKVSPDGSVWRESISINRNTGKVSFPASGFGDGPAITTDYSAAKGTDLVVNGTGMLGTNYNWPDAFALDKVTTPGLPASFRFDGYSPYSVEMTEYLPVNPHSVYLLRSFIRREGPDSHLQYMGLITYDIDRNIINSRHHMIHQGSGGYSMTTLAQPLKPGDTKVYLADASKWNNHVSDAFDKYYYRTLSIFEYRNSYGQRYDHYTRLVLQDAWDPSGVDKTNNVITLKQPLPSGMGNPDDPGGEWPAGTRVANGSTGDNYKYSFYRYLLLPQADVWYRTTNWMGGVDTSGTNVRQNFPPGTAYVRVLWLPNFSNRARGWNSYPDSGPDYSTWFAGVSVVEDTSAKLVANANGSKTIIVPRVNAANDGFDFHTAGPAILEEV